MKTLPAALALIALFAAGCSQEPETTGTTGKTDTVRTKAVTFSDCMRDNGVKDFPDPDASGEMTIDGVLNGSTLDPGSAAWKQAIKACKDLQPAGFTGRKATPKEQDQRLEFADCMRENGVSDFPDPAAGDPLVNTNLIPSSQRPGGMDILNAAMRTCGDLVRDLIDDGR